ncbi:helix-turn-helix domain-containing protein [Streptomyces bottropensis]|uniref:Helix-turn-helix domain-containing protein n=1 Tax=Streptomyces bottropensis TaxID=42235 RepID=A0ABU8AVB9_9ACTN
MSDSELPPTERIRILAAILSGRLTVRDAARRNGLPVRVVERWLKEIPVAASTDRAAGTARAARTADEETPPSRADPRPLPRCRIVVDEMVQGLGL